MTTAFELVVNDRSGYTVKVAGRWLVEIIPMAFNFRVVLTPRAHPETYDHGFCYQGRSLAAFQRAWLAALEWDPTTQLEPAGYDKRATPMRRSVEE